VKFRPIAGPCPECGHVLAVHGRSNPEPVGWCCAHDVCNCTYVRESFYVADEQLFKEAV
jgi:hypothetical protein